ncbi:MAG TPA: hypothetical protein VFT74_13035 [Isosphaeraceae bacterium]|nr:hypothetical protein [Isosphaeraceae bacterium]
MVISTHSPESVQPSAIHQNVAALKVRKTCAVVIIDAGLPG